jgi:hypothetical protein
VRGSRANGPGSRAGPPWSARAPWARTPERRSFISSLPGADVQAIATAVRAHWPIENKPHWLLDLSFHEDACRIRKGHGAQHFSRLRRMALILLHREKTEKLGIANKRLMAGWHQDDLLNILAA